MRRTLSPVLLSLVMASLALMPAAARAARHGANARANVGSDIDVPEGESVGDIACAFCSVHLHGDATGDVAVAFGSVIVDPGHTISGDTAIVRGNLVLGEGAKVNGDLAILAGREHLSEGASVLGSRSVVPEPFGTLILLSPLLILGGIVWLIVSLIRRNRYRFPVSPQGQGIYPPRR